MKHWLKTLGVLLALLPALAAAQEAAATLKSVRGQTTLERDGTKRPARAGEPLFAKDRLTTAADGYAGVGFRDQSSLAIGPNSDVDLSKFSFNATTHQGEQQVRLRSGSLASISGKVAKASPESVQFNTGTMTLGVRGTQFVAEITTQPVVSETPLWKDAYQNIVRSGFGLCWQATGPIAGCPVDKTVYKIVLMPDREGAVGALALSREGKTVEVSKAFAGVEFDDRDVRPTQFVEADVRGRFKSLLDTLPPASQTFVIRFVTGSATQLAPGSQQVLEQVREALARWPVVPNVDVVGHTDTAGKAEQNDALSLQRAQVVSRWLDTAQLPADRLQVSGRGKRQLLVPTPDETPEPLNRRVEITLY